jgi:hypothetical protein
MHLLLVLLNMIAAVQQKEYSTLINYAQAAANPIRDVSGTTTVFSGRKQPLELNEEN